MAAEKKISFFPLFFTVFIDLVGLGIIIPILAPLFLNPHSGILAITTAQNIRTILLGLLIATYPLAQFFGAPILGALADTHGRKKLLLISLAGTLLGYIVFAVGIMTQSIWLLFAARALDGFTGGNISIVYSSIADISDEKTKARNFGLIGMAFGLGFVLGPYIGGKLADPSIVSWFSFSTPFWFAAFLALINIALVVFRVVETLQVRRARKASVTTGMRNIYHAFSSPKLRTLFVVVFLFTFGFNFFTQFFQVYLIQKFQFTQSNIGDLFAYVGLWIAIGQGAISRPISKKFSSTRILSVSLLLLGIALPVLLLPTRAWGLLIVLPFIAIFNGLTQPNTASLVSNTASAESQGEILGMNQSVQSLGQAIPPILAGFIVSIDKTLPITVAGISTLLAWVVFMVFYVRKQKAK